MDISQTTALLPVLFRDFPAVTLSGELKEYSTEELHIHDCYQILQFKSGISLLLDEKKTQPLFHTMTAFIPAGCPHRSVVVGGKVEYMSLYLENELFLSALPRHIRIFDISELGGALMRRIDALLMNKTALNGTRELQWQCLRLFLKILEEDIGKKSALARLPIACQPGNMAICRYLEENYTEKVALRDIARLLPYTLRHVSRMFKDEMKISIFDYLKIYRILQASIQLRATDISVTEIAYACGYNSMSCFFKDFRQIFSATPGQFRSNLKG